MSTLPSLPEQLSNVKSDDRRHRFGKTPAWWAEVCRSRAAHYILTILASFKGKRGCFPSIRRLADAAGCSERTVYHHLAVLESLDLIRRERGNHIVFYEIVYDAATCNSIAEPPATRLQKPPATLLQGHTIEQDEYNNLESTPPALSGPKAHHLERDTGTLADRFAKVRNRKRFAYQPSVDRSPRRPVDPNVSALMTSFQAKYFTITDDDFPTRRSAQNLLKTYGTIDAVMQAAARAKAMESRVCKDGSRFSLSSVLFYSRQFDKSRDAASPQAQQAQLTQVLELLDSAWRRKSWAEFRNITKLSRLSREVVLQRYGDDAGRVLDKTLD